MSPPNDPEYMRNYMAELRAKRKGAKPVARAARKGPAEPPPYAELLPRLPESEVHRILERLATKRRTP